MIAGAGKMARVFVCAAVRKNIAGQISKSESVIEFAVGQQSGVRCDAATIELELQAAVEIDPQCAVGLNRARNTSAIWEIRAIA